ncbi:MAG: FtsX-like permease family protein [Gammaproteobacteria bacterium]|nr:FtsX-like permease family protein [Gammaproteobacteria bacterium]
MKGIAAPLLLRAGLRHLVRHRWQALLALLGIAMGVAVVLAVDLANSAARASFALSAEQLRGNATHRIVGTTGEVPEALYRRLFTTPGHPPMAPVIRLQVEVPGIGQRMQLIGLDIFAERGFRDALGDSVRGQASLADWLGDPGALVVSRSAADVLGSDVGDPVVVGYQGRRQTLRLLAIHPDRHLASRDLLLVDIATAQALSGRPTHLSHIDLILDAAARDWVAERLPPDLQLVEISEQIAGIARMSGAFELNLTAMGLLALLVGVFLIFNAISLAIVQRRPLLGRLRALGVLPGEIAGLVLAEAAILGGIGTLLGVLLGIWLGNALTAIVAATVSELYYEVSVAAARPDAWLLAKATLLGMGGTLAAAWWPARDAAATPPLTTLSRAALERTTVTRVARLAAAGSLLALLGLTFAFHAPGGVISGFAGLFMLLLGAALLTPMALRGVHRVLRPLARRGVWRMATRDLDRHLSRLGTATAALSVALAASVGVAVMVESMRGAVSSWLDDLLAADLYIAAEGFDDGATLPPTVLDEISRLPGLAGTSLYRSRTLSLDGTPLRLVAAALAPRSRAGLQMLARVEEPWTRYDQGAVLISEPLAHRLALSAGDRLVLPTPQGEREFPIAAVVRDYASEHGRVFMPLDRYRDLWSDPLINTLALFGDSPGPTALLDTARRRLSAHPGLVYTAAREIHAESMAVFDRTFRITEVLRYLSLLVAFIGVLSALMALQLERRKEYAVLRALGMTPSQIAALITLQSLLLGLLAALLAIPTGIALAWVLTDAIQVRAFGWSMALQLPPSPVLFTLVLGCTAALLASLYPAWRSSRHDPAPQLRED